MNVIGILRKLETFEEQLGRLYEWLSTVFEGNPDVSGAFFRLSLEERAHARLVAYQRRTITFDRHVVDGGDLFGDVSREIDVALGVISDFRASCSNPTLEEAVALATTLETSAAEKIHRAAVTLVCSELGALVRQLGGDDRKHWQNLKDLVLDAGRLERVPRDADSNRLCAEFPIVSQAPVAAAG